MSSNQKPAPEASELKEKDNQEVEKDIDSANVYIEKDNEYDKSPNIEHSKTKIDFKLDKKSHTSPNIEQKEIKIDFLADIKHDLSEKLEQSVTNFDLMNETDNPDHIIDIEEELEVQKQLEADIISAALDKKLDNKTAFEPVRGRVMHVYMQPSEYYGNPIANAYQTDPGGRNDFVQKVFWICSMMLCVVFISVLMAHTLSPVKRFLRTVLGLLIALVAMFILLILNYIVASNCMRNPPMNYCVCCVGTICYSYVCAAVSAKYLAYVVLGAAGVTLIITLACLGLAFTSFDFTRFILVVIIASLALTLAFLFYIGLTAFTDIRLSKMHLVLLIISCVLTSVMLVIQFQMILGGKSVELGEEEYVFGAYMIFTSIVSLFLNLMMIIGGFNDD